MKIKRNLSDADMLKGFKEAHSFETEILEDSQADNSLRRPNKAAKQGKELLLPAEAQEKLNKYLLELSMEWFKNGNGEVEWKVLKEKDQIIIKPAPSKRKAVK
ncbi:MAG: hypothetical protein GX451_06420 [Acholeplasmataceae bacterium]|nr:hypothetical protein [Acholeplasmataceae bacterium]